MFGVYSAIMVVLVNMLIAMMSNSYQKIANKADEEWKFARSKLWVSFFDEGNSLPAPFSLIPTTRDVYNMCRYFYEKSLCYRKAKRNQKKWLSVRKLVKNASEREFIYQTVIQELIKRYIMRKQQRNLHAGVTEDDMNEIKQDISGLRFELLEIFKNNDFKVDVNKQAATKRGKRGKLNLEKAMNKNFFQESATKQHLAAYESKRIHKFSDSKRSQESKTSSNLVDSTKTLKVKFQDSELNQQHTIVADFKEKGGSGIQTTATVRMALKIKKFTMSKIKKKDTSSISSIGEATDINNLISSSQLNKDSDRSFSDIYAPIASVDANTNESSSGEAKYPQV